MAVALDVQKNISKRRQAKSEPTVAEITDRYTKAKKFLETSDEIALWMSTSILSVIADHLEDFSSGNSEIKVGFQRCCRRMLASAAQRTERVIFFHEAVPGFTVLAVKKEGWEETQITKVNRAKKNASAPADLDTQRTDAMQDLIGAYINRTGNRVILIDGLDLSLILFPVSDLRKNLQEMGFWGN